PAAARLLPPRRPRQEARVSRLAVLGEACPGLRRSRCAAACRRARTRGARSEPHRSHVYRRLERQLVVRGAAPLRVREPAAIAVARRLPEADRLLHRRGGAVCAARQQTEPGGARALPALPRGRAGLTPARARGGDAGADRARGLSQGCGVVGATPAARAAPV